MVKWPPNRGSKGHFESTGMLRFGFPCFLVSPLLVLHPLPPDAMDLTLRSRGTQTSSETKATQTLVLASPWTKLALRSTWHRRLSHLWIRSSAIPQEFRRDSSLPSSNNQPDRSEYRGSPDPADVHRWLGSPNSFHRSQVQAGWVGNSPGWHPAFAG